MKRKELFVKCRKITGGHAKGEALVSKEPICFYLTDPETGRVKEKGHELEGKSIAKKILVFSSGKASSSVQIDGLFKLASNGVAPQAMIVKKADTVLVVSAVIARIPLVDRLEKDPFKIIATGDLVKVDADRGKVSVIADGARARSHNPYLRRKP